MDWRFKDGEIRGRKLVPARATIRRVRPVKFNDLLIMPPHLEVDIDRMDEELRQEREERDSKSLGVQGARVHDLMHARSAVLAGVDKVLTRNVGDFSGLTGLIPVEEP